MPREDLLYRRIAETMAGSIRSGALVRGERLPSVREMARRHGVAPRSEDHTSELQSH